MNRKGEKIGWIFGWFGSFIWLSILSGVWIYQNKVQDGVIGMALFIVSILAILKTAPWKNPDTKYWKLMLPIYILFMIAVIYCIYRYEGLDKMGLRWNSFFWILLFFTPFMTIGSKTWNSMGELKDQGY